ncbi:hypothetical protein P3S68_024287 [Capsicum galapagoense]
MIETRWRGTDIVQNLMRESGRKGTDKGPNHMIRIERKGTDTGRNPMTEIERKGMDIDLTQGEDLAIGQGRVLDLGLVRAPKG